MCATNGEGKPDPPPPPAGRWKERYHARHRFNRITTFPAGIEPPAHVRINRRNKHFLLQWWNPKLKKNDSLRIDGDLLDAWAKARAIDEGLKIGNDPGTSKPRRTTWKELAEGYQADLERRVEAGEISHKTSCRYAAALRHLLVFTARPEIQKEFGLALKADRAFALKFSAYLNALNVSPNGHFNTAKRPMHSAAYVLEASRNLFAWATDPDRGALLPAGFRNPFLKKLGQNRGIAIDPAREPDITIPMTTDFLRVADEYALALFAPIIFFGLRAAEACFLFAEHVGEGWLHVPCISDLVYVTKGKRDKRLPLSSPQARLMALHLGNRRTGLLFVRRPVTAGRLATPPFAASLDAIVHEFRSRCTSKGTCDVRTKLLIRDQVLREAGALTYDEIQHEFSRIARKLAWPSSATLRGFRHLFATSMANAGMPEPYRRYLMGHAPGRDAIVRYTHLDKLREQYEAAINKEWPALLELLDRRIKTMGELARQDAPGRAASQPSPILDIPRAEEAC